MKREVLKTLLWVFIGIIWLGLHQLAVYLIELQYSSAVAPRQVDDDSAYGVLKTRHTVINVVDYVYFAGFLLIIYFILITWIRRSRSKLIAQ